MGATKHLWAEALDYRRPEQRCLLSRGMLFSVRAPNCDTRPIAKEKQA